MNDTSKHKPTPEIATKPSKRKKAYRSPHLEVYGSLDQLTKGGGGNKNEAPGPGTPNTKIN